MRALGVLLERARRWPPIAIDGAIGAGIFTIGAAALVLPGEAVPASQQPAALGILAVEAVAVTLRRKSLGAAFAMHVLASAGGLVTAIGVRGWLLSQFVLLYTISERCGWRVSLLALVSSFPLDVAQSWSGALPKSSELLPYFVDYGFPYFVLVWFAGRAQARRRAITSDLERGASELRREQDRLSLSAVATERTRIARDLYAIVVRGIERMSTQTYAARRALGADPQLASESIGAVEATGRGALIEMRRLLVVLRSQNDGSVLWPAGELPRTEPSAPMAIDSLSPLSTESPASPDWSLARRVVRRARHTAGIPWVTDILVVLVMAILGAAERIWDPYWMRRPSAVVLAVVVVVALLFRRVTPVGVLLLIASVIFVQDAFLGGDTVTADRAIFVAVFTVAALRGPWWGLAAVVAEVVAYLPYLFIPDTCGAGCQLGWATQFVFAVIAGLGVRESRRLNTVLEEQNTLLRRTREEVVRLAVVEERSRIARDVHDLVGHSVTLMVIQAGAARWLAESDRLQADQALAAVERAGQEALRELHSLVSSMDGEAKVAPIPTGERFTIQSLVDREIRAGMEVELIVDGEPHELNAGLDLSLYRVVQEALTNVRKHAPGARAWVRLLYSAEGVKVEVTDSGALSATRAVQTVPGAGQGLVGIRERAALFGGRAEAGPTAEGGFRVRASLREERVLA
ncbi:MAG: histidine kinase [Actinomycetota bacterium]|nr:histidine kinase [Actinomycetota bacterium]